MAINLFHLSPDPNLKLMVPRVPNNRLVRTGKEDGVTPRICFANSINSALAASPPARTGRVLYVYTPTQIDKAAIYKPTPSQVPDVRHTHEVWYTKPTQVKKIGAIIIGDVIRGKYWGTKEEREGHYDLEWYKYKMLKNSNDKKEIKRYMRLQPLHRRKERAKLKNRMIGALGGALASLGGVAIYSLVNNRLTRVK